MAVLAGAELQCHDVAAVLPLVLNPTMNMNTNRTRQLTHVCSVWLVHQTMLAEHGCTSHAVDCKVYGTVTNCVATWPMVPCDDNHSLLILGSCYDQLSILQSALDVMISSRCYDQLSML